MSAGEGNIGHLRRDSNVIHRIVKDSDDVLRPPQEVMDEDEQDRWRELYGWQNERSIELVERNLPSG